MARTKQTARKSTGGKAPRKQLATKSAKSLRQFCTSQQVLGRATTKAGKQRTSYINHENTLSQFSFPSNTDASSTVTSPSPASSSSFQPLVSSAVEQDEHWLGVNFRSVFDGVSGASALRPLVRLRLVVSIDVSGSMASSFDNDMASEIWSSPSSSSSSSRKLDVAKKCLMAIAAQLQPDDELGVVLFNHTATVLQPLSPEQGRPGSRVKALEKALAKVQPGGGTNLAQGFQAGLDLLEQRQKQKQQKQQVRAPPRPVMSSSGSSSIPPAPPSSSSSASAAAAAAASASFAASPKDSDDDQDDGRSVVSRCVFMTDMESSQHDEDQVLAAAAAAASSSSSSVVFTTVVGIGVDLSVGAVQALSQTVGGRYASVCSASEFERVAGGNGSPLVHDAVPIAYDIQCSVVVNIGNHVKKEEEVVDDDGGGCGGSGGGGVGGSGGSVVPLLAGCGHPEAALITPGSSTVTFSSEFATSGEGEPPILLRISPPPPPPTDDDDDHHNHHQQQLAVQFKWKNWDGSPGFATVIAPTIIPPTPTSSSPLLQTGSSLTSSSSSSSPSSSDPSSLTYFSNVNLRKALALMRFVDFQETYMTDDRNDGEGGSDDDDDDETSEGESDDDDDDVQQQQSSLRTFGARKSSGGRVQRTSIPQGPGIRFVTTSQLKKEKNKNKKNKNKKKGAFKAAAERYKAEAAAQLLLARAAVAFQWAGRAAAAKAALESEVGGACGDVSVLSGGENQAFSGTLQQIAELEGKDAEALKKRAAKKLAKAGCETTAASAAALTASAASSSPPPTDTDQGNDQGNTGAESSSVKGSNKRSRISNDDDDAGGGRDDDEEEGALPFSSKKANSGAGGDDEDKTAPPAAAAGFSCLIS